MNLLVSALLLTLSWTFVHSNNQRDKLFFLQKPTGEDYETLLVVTWTESDSERSAGCEIFTDKDLINEVLKSSGDADIRTLNESKMQNVLDNCTEYTIRRRRRESGNEVTTPMVATDIKDNSKNFLGRSNKRVDSSAQLDENREIRTSTMSSNRRKSTTEAPTTASGYDGLPIIFPGTKWCGAGDSAKDYDDLGFHQDTDRCCRAHDLCNDTLAPGETKNNLTNKSPFTKLSCKCDHDFYNCLDRVNSVTGNTIGNMYFNILKRECYQADYPTTNKCRKYKTIFKIRCHEYEKDTNAPKVYQWVKAKKYKKIPFPGPLTITLPF